MSFFREGNAVHTVHLWQPSGNRPNKPKMPGEKKKKGAGNKRRDQITNSSQKRIARKKKNDEPSTSKPAPPPTNIIPEQTVLPFHNPGNSKRRQNIVTISYNTTHIFIRKETNYL